MVKPSWVGTMSTGYKITFFVSIYIAESSNRDAQIVTGSGAVHSEKEGTISARIDKNRSGSIKSAWTGTSSTNNKFGFSIIADILDQGDGGAHPLTSGAVFLEKKRAISAGIDKNRTGLGKSVRAGCWSTDNKIGFCIPIHIPRPSYGITELVTDSGTVFLKKEGAIETGIDKNRTGGIKPVWVSTRSTNNKI